MVNCSPKVAKKVTGEPIPTAAEIAAMYSEDQLEIGKNILHDDCAKCHKVFDPNSRTPEQWNAILRRMIPKARLNEADARLVRAYLIKHAKAQS